MIKPSPPTGPVENYDLVLRTYPEAEILDWNTLTLEQMAEHLRKEFQFDSSGTARCVFALLEFYDKNKP